MGEMTMKKLQIIMMLAILGITAYATASQAARTHDQILEQARVELERVCGSLVPYMERPENVSRFEVVDEDVINAFADNQGRVAVYMGMIDFFQNEDELAAVCGHELAHLSREHIKKSMSTGILATVVSEVVGGTAGNIVGNLIYTKDSRSHEREADRNGLLYAWHAGFDPYASVGLWEGMSQMRDTMALEKYLSTHPVHEERIENFHVLLYRMCKEGRTTRYCEEIQADPELQRLYREFESRD